MCVCVGYYPQSNFLFKKIQLVIFVFLVNYSCNRIGSISTRWREGGLLLWYLPKNRLSVPTILCKTVSHQHNLIRSKYVVYSIDSVNALELRETFYCDRFHCFQTYTLVNSNCNIITTDYVVCRTSARLNLSHNTTASSMFSRVSGRTSKQCLRSNNKNFCLYSNSVIIFS